MGNSLAILSYQINRDEYTLILVTQRLTYYQNLLSRNTYPFTLSDVQQKITKLQNRRTRILHALDKNTTKYHEVKAEKARKTAEKVARKWKKAEDNNDWYRLGKLRVKELAKRNAEGRMGLLSGDGVLPPYSR